MRTCCARWSTARPATDPPAFAAVAEAAEGDTPMFGYALDGYPVHSPYADDAEEGAAGLDGCNGHTTVADGYHYHANQAAENQVITCLVGQTAASEGAAGGAPGAGPVDGGGPPAGGNG